MKLLFSPTSLLALSTALLFSTVAAAPVTSNTTDSEITTLLAAPLAARQAPPVVPKYTGPVDTDGIPTEDGAFTYAMANWPDPERTKDAVFWTGFAGDVDSTLPTRFIEQQLKGKGLWFEDVFRKQPGDAQARFIEDAVLRKPDAIRWKPTARASQAFAKYAHGTAWLLIPKGVSEIDPYPGKPKADGGTGRFANWVFFEYNTLTRNAEINKIVRVNPDDFTDQQTLWKAGDKPFGEPATSDSDTKPRWLSCPAAAEVSDADAANDGI